MLKHRVYFKAVIRTFACHIFNINSQGLGERKRIKGKKDKSKKLKCTDGLTQHGLLLQSFCTEKNQYVYLIVVNVNMGNISFISKINYLN